MSGLWNRNRGGGEREGGRRERELTFFFFSLPFRFPFRWTAPRYIREKTDEEQEKIREKYHISTEGEDVPPPCPDFQVRELNFFSFPPSLLLERESSPSLWVVACLGHETSTSDPQVPQGEEDRQAFADSDSRDPDSVSRVFFSSSPPLITSFLLPLSSLSRPPLRLPTQTTD